MTTQKSRPVPLIFTVTLALMLICGCISSISIYGSINNLRYPNSELKDFPRIDSGAFFRDKANNHFYILIEVKLTTNDPRSSVISWYRSNLANIPINDNEITNIISIAGFELNRIASIGVIKRSDFEPIEIRHGFALNLITPPFPP